MTTTIAPPTYLPLLTIQSGDFTINLNMISEIEWKEDEEATVTMASGQSYTCELDDYHALKARLGIK